MSLSLFEAVVVALAGWRLAYLITNEAGPANVIGSARARLPMELKPGSASQLFACVYCMSFWTVTALALAWIFVDVGAYRDAVEVIAMWGAATALDMAVRKE